MHPTTSKSKLRAFKPRITKHLCLPVSERLESRRLLATIFLAQTSAPFALVGRPYSFTMAAYGPDADSKGPYTYTRPADFDGLTFAATNNVLVLSGTPLESGTFSFTLDVTDQAGDTGAQNYTLSVAKPSVPGINLCLDASNSSLEAATAGVPYSETLNATGGNNQYTYNVPSNVDGLTLFPYLNTVELSGTPLTAGTFPFTVTTNDSAGGKGTQSFVLDVGIGLVPGMLPYPGDSLAPGLVGQPYQQAISAMGTTGTVSFSHPATVDGLQLDTLNGALVVHGTPRAAGSFPFSVTADDSANRSVSFGYTLNVASSPVTLGVVTASGQKSTDPNSLAPAEVGQPYSQTFDVSGGSGTYPASSRNFPTDEVNGLGFTYDDHDNTLTLSGTPTQAGTFGYLAAITDSFGLTSTVQQYMLYVAGASSGLNLAANGAPTQPLAPVSLPAGSENMPYIQTFVGFDGAAGYDYSIDESKSALPAGLTFTSNRVVATLSGVPTEAGTFPIVVDVDNDGTRISTPYLLTIAPVTPLQLTRQSIEPGMVGLGYTQALISDALSAYIPSIVWKYFPYQFTAAGGSGGYLFTAAGLPPGMTFTSDGQLGGTPALVGDFAITVRVTDSAGDSAAKTYDLSVAPCPPFGNGESVNPYNDFTGVAYQPDVVKAAFGYNNVILSGGVIGTGKGQTIALIENSDQASFVSSIPALTLNRPDQVSYANSDLAAFSTAENLPQFGQSAGGDAPVFIKLTSDLTTDYPLAIVTPESGPQYIGSNGEFAQDVTTIHSLAPEANIVVFIAPPGATDDDLARIYQTAMSFPNNIPGLSPAMSEALQGLPPVSIVSSSVYNSYVESLDELNQEKEYLPPFPTTQPASVVIAAGDTGYFVPWITGPQYPGNSGNVISAAMTQPSISSDGTLLSEIGVSNAGGGPSLYLPQSSWQNGVVDYYSTTTRVSPDVGMVGSFNSGMLLVLNGQWDEANGSSNAAPAWAALLAIMDQGRALLGEQPMTTAEALASLYSLPASDFQKITQLDDGTDVPGNYNDAAGLGSPVANRLVAGMDGGHDIISGSLIDAATGSGLAGWTVFLDVDNDGAYHPGVDPTTLSNASGAYQFLVAPGTHYQVRVASPAGSQWVQTSADPGAISFTPGSDLAANNVNFVFDVVIHHPTLPLNGRLDPASDTGLSDDDGITFVASPIFEGTTAAGAVVQVSAQLLGSSSVVVIGTATANSQGNWSVTSSTLSDGRYTITAKVADQTGDSPSTSVLLPNPTEGYLTIDTQSPRIVAVSISPRQGQILITFQDNLSGLAQPIALNSQNYVLRRLRRHPFEKIKVSTSVPIASDAPQVVVLQLDSKAVRRSGSYGLEVLSGGIEDVAGNLLAGNFGGLFPTGPVPGGLPANATFRAGFSMVGRRATRLRPLTARFFATLGQTPRATSTFPRGARE